MRARITFTKPKGFFRERVADIIKWALSEELEELREQDDTLYGFFDTNDSIQKRYETERRDSEKRHSDWLGECDKTQKRHDEFLKLVVIQNESIEGIHAAIERRA